MCWPLLFTEELILAVDFAVGMRCGLVSCPAACSDFGYVRMVDRTGSTGNRRQDTALLAAIELARDMGRSGNGDQTGI